MKCKSGRTYVRHKIFKIDRQNPKLFFSEKSFTEQNDIKKSIKQNKYFHRKYFHCFLKVLTTFYKEISQIISAIVIKER